MNLPFLTRKQKEKDFFLALLLSSGEIRSILFEKNGESLLILDTHKEEFSETLDSLTSERLIELSDIVISEVEKFLPSGADLQKTIFAVPDRWVSEGKIVKEHLLNLKSICDALHLTPVGFIVSIEAIIAYLHKKEGVPVTAIVVEIGKKHIAMSLVKNGIILTVKEHEIEENPVATVEKLLASQEELEVLPAKIILLNYENAKKIQQSFLSHSWGKGLQFLHIPQVEVLDHEVESQAVISGVASQMGFNTLPSINLERVEKEAAPVEVAVENEEVGQETDEVEEVSRTEDESENASSLKFKGEEVGFFKEVDVLKKTKETVEPESLPEEKVSQETVQESFEHEEKKELSPVSLPVLSRVRLPNIPFNVPNFPKPKGKLTFFYPILAVVLFILLIVSYYYLFEKAEVTIYLDKKGVNKELSVVFAEDKNTSAGDSIVHIDTTSVQENGKEEQSATGKKETGEKAKGEVTILSSLNKSQTIEKGTTLTSSNGLKYALDNDIAIASSSGVSDIKSVKAKVAAEKIGKEYNLPSNTKFSVGDFNSSSVEAKNDSAFSGGTKKEVTVVAADDISSLQTRIVETLGKKAMLDASGKIGTGSKILSFPLDYSFDEKTYSKKEGEAANTVSLAATITYKLGSYKSSDLISLAKDITSKDAPSGYTYSGKDSEIQVKGIKENDGDISGKLIFASVFLPQISSDSISAKIAGKSTQKAEELVRAPGISDDLIVFTRSLPFFPQIMPFNKKNISVIVKSQ